jgi:hypothetical protein
MRRPTGRADGGTARAIEAEIDRVRSLGLDEPRARWRTTWQLTTFFVKAECRRQVVDFLSGTAKYEECVRRCRFSITSATSQGFNGSFVTLAATSRDIAGHTFE